MSKVSEQPRPQALSSCGEKTMAGAGHVVRKWLIRAGSRTEWLILHVRQIIVDPGNHGHARNVIPGFPPSWNRSDDVTSGPPVPHAALRVPCQPDTSPVLAPPRLIGFSPTGDLTLCRKSSWVLTRCFESPSTPPPHPPQAQRTRRIPNACRSFGGVNGLKGKVCV
jgi:hypothetical protein